MKFLACLILVVALHSDADAAESGCRFLRTADLPALSPSTVVRVGDFQIYTNNPQSVLIQRNTIERSSHFLQTELGWRFPFTRKELGRPVLDVRFVPAKPDFTGTVLPGPLVVFHEDVLASPDFAAIWIHQLGHASSLLYRTSQARPADVWFYEATAGWLEGHFDRVSKVTRMARAMRKLHPRNPLEDPSADMALGASSFLDALARPHRDVIRQTWEQWSFSHETVMQIIDRVLRLNHLPGLDSYLLNYYLRTPGGAPISDSTMSIVLSPYSAIVLQVGAAGRSGGGSLVRFEPAAETKSYSACFLYYAQGENEGVLKISERLNASWSGIVPYSGMDRYKIILVNTSGAPLRGTLETRFDPSIPATLEFFRATEDGDGGALLEWKTMRENGVAFWNVYRIHNGRKERLNELPLPAGFDSMNGMHYVFVDYTTGSFYSLEALTGDGFPSIMATVPIEP